MEQLTRRDNFEKLEGTYFVWTHDGVQFLDVLTSEPLVANQPPRSVAEHPMLGVGLNNLRQLGARGNFTVQLVLAEHKGPQQAWEAFYQHTDIFEAARFVGTELSWTGTDAARPYLSEVHIKLAAGTGLDEFQKLALGLLSANRKIVFPCVYESASEPFGVVLNSAWTTYLAATRNEAGLDEPTRNRLRHISLSAHQAIRQWAVLGQYGYWLLDAEAEQPWVFAQPLAVPLLLGSWHAPQEQRLRDILGVSVETYTTHHALSSYETYAPTYLDMVTRGAATSEQLNTPIPF